MTCSQCGAQLPQGTDRCPSCYYPVPRASFAQRILRALGFRVPAPRTVVKTRTTEIRTEGVEVQDPQTGQVRVYRSLDEVPGDIRAKLARRRDDGLDALAGCGMGEGLADLFEGEARRDEPLDAKPRHEGERAPEGGAAAEGAEDPDLTEVGVPEVQGNVASLRAHAD